jgi:DNA-nicking Smr family endonuclease
MTRRRLSDDERALWRDIVRSIAPLHKLPPAEVADEAQPPKPAPKTRAKADIMASREPSVAAAKPAAPPRLAPLGRRLKQRVARGSHPIDGRFDLHGMTQAEAHAALLAFLRRSQAHGCRLVLVITGKGGGEGSGRGVLKRMVPQWLPLPEFRELVVGFENAAIGHGGEGALYIRLRRPRDA